MRPAPCASARRARRDWRNSRSRSAASFGRLDIPELRRELVRRSAIGPTGARRLLNGATSGRSSSRTPREFLTAEPEARARRRFEEERLNVQDINYDETLADINARDRRDSERDDSPLAIADDAFVIDTTELSVEDVFRRMLEVVRERRQPEDGR